MFIGPHQTNVNGISFTNGFWGVTTGTWDNIYFSSAPYGLNDTLVYRLWSFPYAMTGGGDGDVGNPGSVLNTRERFKGSWFKDIAWIAGDPGIDGAVQASVRFGSPYSIVNQFDFKARSGEKTYQNVTKSNGLIKGISWHKDSYTGPRWNPPNPNPLGLTMVGQEACMAGLICHSPELGKKYAFVWEANSDLRYSSHTDDTWKAERFDRTDYTKNGCSVGTNKLYLVVSDYDESDVNWATNEKYLHMAVAQCVPETNTIVPGKPADLKLIVSGGTIYCFYRATALANAAPNQWRFAFSYKAGRFGAGRFGIVGRGHAGIQWDTLYPGKDKIIQYDNYVDFWNVHYSNGVMDWTLEEVLRHYAWGGYTQAKFRTPLVSDGGFTVGGGSYKNYDVPAQNQI